MLLAGHRAAPLLNNTGVVLLPTDYGADRDLRADPAAGPSRTGVRVQRRRGAPAPLDAARAVGGFPARFFLYYEDTDLSWRLRLAGWDIRYEPAAVVHHAHSATVGPDVGPVRLLQRAQPAADADALRARPRGRRARAAGSC